MSGENTETKTEAQKIEEATALFSVDSAATPETKDDAENKPVIAAEDAENTETQESVEETDDEASDETPQPKKKITAAERVAQIKAATRELHEERRALEAARTVAAENKPKETSKPEAKEDAPPKPEDFEYGELDSRYIDAKVQYGVAQGLKTHEAKLAERDAIAAQQREVEAYNKKADGFMTLGTEKYPDFTDTIEMVRNKEIPMSRDMAKLILDTPDEGVHVLQHLAANPKEAQQVFSKSPLEQAAYFGRTAAMYSSSDGKSNGQPAVKVTKAPAPIKGAKGSGAKPSTGQPNEFEQFVTY